ncbi:MAG TPA: phosphatidylserine decarboxylase [Candidatus Methanoperedenaceae archaeon]|nr:phosphatidylserine decarboxylase [Candidatus Methanoperedenaceae archaeon]
MPEDSTTVIAKGGRRISVTLIILTATTGALQLHYRSTPLFALFFLTAGFTAFTLFFFRDPERSHLSGEAGQEEMIAPADGRVIECSKNKICIFMTLSDVHVNRAPIDGRVKCTRHVPGNHIQAYKKDSKKNERNHILIETTYGDVLVTQIAGILARRIVTYITSDTRVRKGQRIGMIRYGSRVDVTVPPGFEILVSVGERLRCGETIIARVVKP